MNTGFSVKTFNLTPVFPGTPESSFVTLWSSNNTGSAEIHVKNVGKSDVGLTVDTPTDESYIYPLAHGEEMTINVPEADGDISSTLRVCGPREDTELGVVAVTWIYSTPE
jgi:hypothetical protein